MSKFRVKSNISDKDLMTHVLNNLPEEYDMNLNGLENHLMSSGADMLTIEVINKELSHQYEK